MKNVTKRLPVDPDFSVKPDKMTDTNIFAFSPVPVLLIRVTWKHEKDHKTIYRKSPLSGEPDNMSREK